MTSISQEELEKIAEKEEQKFCGVNTALPVIGELYLRIQQLEQKVDELNSISKTMDEVHNKEIRNLDMMVRKIMKKTLTVKEMETLMITISEEDRRV